MHTWTPQAGPLPTLPGKVSGIVAYWDRTPDSRPRVTVQCACCLRTLTGDLSASVRACNFAPDEGAPGHTRYRRCADCRTARLHPERETMAA